MKKVLFSATVDAHILAFHIPFLKYFKEQGYEVHVATNGTEEIPYCDKKIIIPFERSPFKINNLKAIKELRKVIQKEHYDIIHTHTPMGSVVTRLAAKKARRNGTRVIYTAHGFHFFKGAPLLNWCLFYPVEKYLSKYTDTLILINQEDYQRAKKKFKKCKDIKYVPGVGIDEEKFDFQMSEKEKLELRKSLGLKKDDFVLIYPAELNKNKNQILLIEAMEQLVKKYPNIKLLLPGKDSYHGYYQKIVAEKNLCDHIFFLGFRKDIPELLKISDLAVASSLREGLPVNIMEAMHVGLPVIATNCRGQRDLVEDGLSGYIISYDSSFFVSKILELYQNREKYDEFSRNGLEKSQEYRLSDILRKMDAIYTQKKKVLHLLASNKYSGAENVVCTIINGTSSDYESIYCSIDGPIKEQLIQKHIPYLLLPKLSYIKLKRIVNDFRPDIIHAHDFKASCLGGLFFKSCRVIAHIHGNNKIMNTVNLKSVLFLIMSHFFKKIVYVSSSSYEGYIFKKHIKDKAIILCNVVDKDRVIQKSKEWICEKKYDMIFLGRLAYPKNPERLMEIVNSIHHVQPDFKTAVVGDGIDKEKIIQMAKDYHIFDSIDFYGFVANPFPILKNSKIMIMTSIYEGTPMSALEAQALGKPIVSTPVDGLKSIIKNNYNGYLSNDNDIIVKNILNLVNDSDFYSSMVKNVEKSFSDYNDLKQYIQIIEGLYK